jgi:hypothetical protein
VAQACKELSSVDINHFASLSLASSLPRHSRSLLAWGWLGIEFFATHARYRLSELVWACKVIVDQFGSCCNLCLGKNKHFM